MNHMFFSGDFCGVDLNTDAASGDPQGRISLRTHHVHRQNSVCAVDGLSALDNLYSNRQSLRRQSSYSHASLCRTFSCPGVCSVDLSRKPSRYRGVPFGAIGQALPYGYPLAGQAIHSGRRQRAQRLAHLCRVRPTIDHASPQARKLYAGEDLGLDLSNSVYALDSTTIDLCLSVFPWAPFRSTKAAVKMHTLLDLRGNIPSFIHISDGKLHDVNALDLMIPEPGAIYVMDRAYLDFDRLFSLHEAGAFFVTRAKSNTNFRRVYSALSDREQGIICDQTVALSGFYSQQKYPLHLRRIRFKDIETGKTLIFLTNFFGPPAATICALYKARWQVELFFKWIKQHLRIKQFYGTSENAVKAQIWTAVSMYVLVAIIKKRLNLDASLYTLLQIFSITLFEKIPLNKDFLDRSHGTESDMFSNQLNLFNC